MGRIVSVEVVDVRFPTSRWRDGSDAMNPDPDYSAAYVTLHTDDGGDDGSGDGFGLVFTIGRGNDVAAAAVRALEPHLVGRPAAERPDDLADLYHGLVGDSQLRWLGPEKGVMHMAIGAVVNAAWDMASRRAKVPLWQYIGTLSPEELVDQVDFRYLTDALTRDDALHIVRAGLPGRDTRSAHLLERGYPAYTTSAGWLGYDDAKVVRLAREAVADGFDLIKLKVGADLDDDVRRLRLVRETVGPGIDLAIDANQRWDVGEAIEWVRRLAPEGIRWVEEPTSPDDVLGLATIAQAVAPIPVASGEHVANRIMFKQLLQTGGLSVLQLDACRVGGVNENLAILLLAAKHGVRVCPHAGGVGLCELVQHLAMADFVAISGSMDGRVIEYVDHLHEHFVDPVEVKGGRYVAPRAPGFGARMHASSVARFRFPDGPEWAT
ncbi:MAG: enolase C-terminal domain-like protein [Ilumatobacteraceae bacterium]